MGGRIATSARCRVERASSVCTGSPKREWERLDVPLCVNIDETPPPLEFRVEGKRGIHSDKMTQRIWRLLLKFVVRAGFVMDVRYEDRSMVMGCCDRTRMRKTRYGFALVSFLLVSSACDHSPERMGNGNGRHMDASEGEDSNRASHDDHGQWIEGEEAMALALERIQKAHSAGGLTIPSAADAKEATRVSSYLESKAVSPLKFYCKPGAGTTILTIHGVGDSGRQRQLVKVVQNGRKRFHWKPVVLVFREEEVLRAKGGASDGSQVTIRKKGRVLNEVLIDDGGVWARTK